MITNEDLLQKLLSNVVSLTESKREDILRAYYFAEEHHKGQKRLSGEEYIIHPLSVAIILTEFHADYEMIIAALLHDIVEDTAVSLDEIKSAFSDNIALLVDGVTKITKLKSASKREKKAETIRKMLFAMTKDLRIIIIKFADKLHNMRTLQFMSKEKRKRISKEVIDIYAPLAGKVGMNLVKDQLEDLAFKWLHSDAYSIINSYFNRIEKDRVRTLALVKRKLTDQLQKNNIYFRIKSRAKHFYSIYKKMKKYNKSIEEIFDLYGIRIITDSIANCYQIFGVVHILWQPLPGRFKDYIAKPKDNGYKSLHTCVIIEKRKAVEIQIRTEEMEEINEYGIAAHWYYKKNYQPDLKELKWLKQLKEVHNEGLGSIEYYKTLRDDILKDLIYIFTPKGDIIEMPKGSTPLDFAYRIHSEIGHRCRGAKANGKIIPLYKPLKNGMVVDIITGKDSNPKESWLSFIKTSHARKKIKSWFASHKQQDTDIKQENKKQESKHVNKEQPKENLPKIISSKDMQIEVNGEKNLLYSFAKCCKPHPPDPIVGFISRGRGLIIHKKDCHNIKSIKDFEKRKIQANWVLRNWRNIYTFRFMATEDSSPFDEIGRVIYKYSGIFIESKIFGNHTKDGRKDGFFSVKFPKKTNISLLLKEIRKIPTILNIEKEY